MHVCAHACMSAACMYLVHVRMCVTGRREEKEPCVGNQTQATPTQRGTRGSSGHAVCPRVCCARRSAAAVNLPRMDTVSAGVSGPSRSFASSAVEVKNTTWGAMDLMYCTQPTHNGVRAPLRGGRAAHSRHAQEGALWAPGSPGRQRRDVPSLSGWGTEMTAFARIVPPNGCGCV